MSVLEPKPKGISEKEAALRQQSEADLQYFWHSQGVADPFSLTIENRKLIFDVPLNLYTGEITRSSHYPDKRNERVEAFEELGFLPKSAAEIRMATAKDEEEIFETKGPEERLRRATHTGRGTVPRAQKSTFETIDSYYDDAKTDRTALIKARIISSRSNIGDINIIRSDPEILNIIADYLHGRQILDSGLDDNRNTNVFKAQQKYWRGYMHAAAQSGFASDEALLAIYKTVWNNAEARTDYWRGHREAAYKKVGHVLVDDVQEKEIPVRVIEETEEESDEEPEVEPKDSNPHPWENFVPPTPIGGNYQIDGIEEVPIVQKPDDEESGPSKRETVPKTELPRPLFSTKEMIKSPRRKPQKSRRGRRGFKGQAMSNADEPPPSVPDTRKTY